MTAHRSDKFDLPAALGEAPGLVKSQVIYGYNFGRSPQRDTVPTQEAGNFHISRSWHETYKD